MTTHTYTVFSCNNHNDIILLENIHKDIPSDFLLIHDKYNADYCQIGGYITINNGNITYDLVLSINIDILKCSIYNKDYNQIKLTLDNPLIEWFLNPIEEFNY